MNRARREFLGMAARAGVGALSLPWLTGCPGPVSAAAAPSAPALPKDISGGGSLRAHAAARGILYGCAVDVGLLGKDEAYTALVKQQAEILVAENSMKWAPMRPSPTEFNFEEADKLVAFARENGMRVRGHNLCWHRQLPRWFSGYATRFNARALLTEHIKAVAGRYAGKIHSWDVVNEAVLPSDGRPDGLRASPWLKLIGPEYIELAFRTARAADPQALLTYNDYGIEAEDEASTRKRTAVLNLVSALKNGGAPIDAVGVQSHIEAGKSYGAGLANFMKAIRELGLQIFVTEMEVNDRELPPDLAVRDKAVAKTYAEYLDLALREPALKTVLTWGITDAHTWLNEEDARRDGLPERCLPFDAELKPVEAFFAIRKSFDTKTNAS